MAVAPAAAAPIATAANTRVTTMSGAETAALSTHDEDFYSVSREHLFATNVICISVNEIVAHSSFNHKSDHLSSCIFKNFVAYVT